MLALASAAVHLPLLYASSFDSLVMLLMAAACLPCAWHLWRSPSASVWRFTAVADAAMLALHLQMPGGSGHEMAGMDPGGPAGGPMWFGLGPHPRGPGHCRGRRVRRPAQNVTSR